MSHVQALTHATFDRVIASATSPVLVDFHATWCAPCRALGPFLEQFAREYAGKIEFAKVDIDEAPELAARFDVRAVPTLMLFAGGEQIYDIPGFVPPQKLRTFLDSVARAGSRVATEQG